VISEAAEDGVASGFFAYLLLVSSYLIAVVSAD